MTTQLTIPQLVHDSTSEIAAFRHTIPVPVPPILLDDVQRIPIPRETGPKMITQKSKSKGAKRFPCAVAKSAVVVSQARSM